MRVYISFLVVMLIAVQSVFSIPDLTTTHQYSHELSHQESAHDYSTKLHSSANQLVGIDDNHSKHLDSEEHPDCHQHHCHHSSIVFVELESLQAFAKQKVHQLITSKNFFSSNLVSPDLRPPIF